MYTIMKGSKYVRNNKLYGGKSSYTYNPAYAVRFNTLEEAQRNCCPENEHVVRFNIYEILDRLAGMES